jgi:bifunctional non-homologous end joining protein LigD
VKRLAMMTEDHPFAYRNFEGVIPEGNYGAGKMIIWDEGTLAPVSDEIDPKLKGKALRAAEEEVFERQLAKGHLKFRLEGTRLHGAFSLLRTQAGRGNQWLLVKKADEFADADFDVGALKTSARTGAEIGKLGAKKAKRAKSPKPHKIKPMLATLADGPFHRAGWLYEIKWDGYRAVAELTKKGGVELVSRNLKPLNDKYPDVVAALAALKLDAVLDGEVVLLDENGQTSFNALQNAATHAGSKGELAYCAFDLLYLDGEDYRGKPLRERKAKLAEIFENGRHLRLSEAFDTDGVAFFEAAQKLGLEGIIAKDGDSLYQTGARSESWQKIKTARRQEVVIGGYTDPQGAGRKHVGALIIGVHDEAGDLVPVGRVGTGFGSVKELADLGKKLRKLERKTSPFTEAKRLGRGGVIHWVKPELVCEVTFTEWTPDGSMRHPVFVALRDDKSAAEVGREEAKAVEKTTDGKLELSNLGKVYFPEKGYTKGDLIAYYRDIGPTILPYLLGRPQSLRRQPNGIHGKSFFQKDLKPGAPAWLQRQEVATESRDDGVTDYLVCDGLDSLLYMVNLGCIEINPWASRVEALDRPDFITLDLDPEAVGMKEVAATANAVRKLCEELELESYVKTSGKRGLHVVLPLGARYDYEQAKDFSQLWAELVHRRVPRLTSLAKSPRDRQGKVYLDYLRNSQGQTAASVYSARPTPQASVSMPLKWSEVTAKLDPLKFTIKTAQKRLDAVGDLWQPVLGEGIDLAKAVKRIRAMDQ